MGDHQVHTTADADATRRFAQALLDDLAALETLVRDDRLECGVQRIGFEQECFLVDADGRPAHCAPQLLDKLDPARFTSEIGRFNLEFGVDPLILRAGALRTLEAAVRDGLADARAVARQSGADLALAGILPSITRADLTRAALSPGPRYAALDTRLVALAGGAIRTSIQGDDDLQLELDSVMLEACNTSIQVHLQVDPSRLVAVYNLTQLVTAPVLAVAANSPLLLQRRLWHESRIPTFEQSVDARSEADRARGVWQRVHFGDAWVHGDILELYRDQLARHPVVLTRDLDEVATQRVARGAVPRLRALALHNGTLYRWNRLCYGVLDGVPHLRIEHRPLPAGPTVRDEMANVAFFLGLVLGLERTCGDPAEQLSFADARANFHAAAHHGLDATLRWIDGRTHPVRRLVLDTLLPLAQDGLRDAGLDDDEITHTLDVIAARAEAGVNGAGWLRDGWQAFAPLRNPVARAQALTRAMQARQWSVEPVTAWPPASPVDLEDAPARVRRVEEVMSTDLFTVRADDLLAVAGEVMRWKHIRHVPVQDDAGALVGLLSYRQLLAGRDVGDGASGQHAVRDVMITDVCTAAPHDTCAEAVARLRRHGVGCLPVVHEGRLVGIVSERDLLPFAAAWFEARATRVPVTADPVHATPRDRERPSG